MNDPWMDRLSDYLDEDLSPAERAQADAHLADCPACVRALEDLRRVRARARSLADSPAPRGLWEGIESRITAARTVPFPLPAEPAKSRAARGTAPRERRVSFSMPQLIAACLAAALISGVSVFAWLNGRVPRGAESLSHAGATAPPSPARAAEPREDLAARDRSVRREAAPAERRGEGERHEEGARPAPSAGATFATSTPEESPQEAAIADLKKALASGRDRLDPATVRTLQSNLAIIELAIDQGKRALAADPSNSYVKEHLADTMRRKVELLQRATVLASTTPEVSR
jgi:putative zinc finger protein